VTEALQTQPVVVICEEIDPEAKAWLSERARVIDAGAKPSDEALSQADGLVVRTYTRVDEALLARAPRLRVVGRAGVGIDHIDLRACAARGVRVVHTPDANSAAVTELVFATVLSTLRPTPRVNESLDPEAWQDLRERSIAPMQLEGSTLGVYGLGRVGRRVVRTGAALGMRVLFHDLREIPAPERDGAEPVERDELLRESHVLSIHVDGRISNQGLIDAGVFAQMRPDVLFVNTSRGFVVDEAACAAFLRSNPGARATLDVHAAEPIVSESPLIGLKNAVLLPHIGSATRSAKLAMSWVVRDVVGVLSGEPPRFEAESGA